jgi:hypothetical protein
MATLWGIAACEPITVPVDVPLGNNLGSFEVQAGVPLTHRGTVTGIDTTVEVGSGNLAFDTDDITVTPADGGGGKRRDVNLQDTTVLIVTAWIDDVAALETVCEAGEEYGPFEVTLDENYVPVAIDPDHVNLSQTTVDLINGGEFSLCLEILSPIDATITIERLTLNLGL